MITPEWLAETRDLCNYAAEAPWLLRGYAGEHDEAGGYVTDATGKQVASTYGVYRENGSWKRYIATAEYIARMHPLATLALLDEVERLRKVIDASHGWTQD